MGGADNPLREETIMFRWGNFAGAFALAAFALVTPGCGSGGGTESAVGSVAGRYRQTAGETEGVRVACPSNGPGIICAENDTTVFVTTSSAANREEGTFVSLRALPGAGVTGEARGTWVFTPNTNRLEMTQTAFARDLNGDGDFTGPDEPQAGIAPSTSAYLLSREGDVLVFRLIPGGLTEYRTFWRKL
jgi:hypothetical protein